MADIWEKLSEHPRPSLPSGVGIVMRREMDTAGGFKREFVGWSRDATACTVTPIPLLVWVCCLTERGIKTTTTCEQKLRRYHTEHATFHRTEQETILWGVKYHQVPSINASFSPNPLFNSLSLSLHFTFAGLCTVTGGEKKQVRALRGRAHTWLVRKLRHKNLSSNRIASWILRRNWI